MSDDTTLIEQTAREMISRDGAAAASIAREWAEIAKGLNDPLSAEAWLDIADEIERLDVRRHPRRRSAARGGRTGQGPHREGPPDKS
jgi:hypothetical protein